MKGVRIALLVLAAKEAAIFSKRAATEGLHESLAHPTGAALLGWAAGRYEDFGKSSWTIFHSGKVRFSNALPLSSDGEAAYPIPELLMAPKHDSGPAINGRLDGSQIFVGRPTSASTERTTQYEALRKIFVTPSLRIHNPSFGARRRTATHLNRAAEGQFFEYQHLRPSERQLYAATIEACPLEDGGIEDAEWQMILEQFDGKTLVLGRAKNSHGAFDCAVRRKDGERLWPRGGVRKGQTRVRVWALSDLALVDRFGAPSFAPACSLLKLPDGGRLNLGQSTIATRRYSPWNRKLGGRDFERQVIQAGSVLTYDYDEGAIERDQDGVGTVGLWQEVGLGRTWVSPEILEGERPSAMSIDAIVARSSDIEKSPADEKPSDPVVNWATRMSSLSETGARDSIIESLQDQFDKLYRSTGRVGPSPSQWNAVAVAAKSSPNLTALNDALFSGQSPVCGTENQSTRQNDWGAAGRLNDSRVSFRRWLMTSLAAAGPVGELNSVRTIRRVVTQLAKHAAERARHGDRV